MQGILQLLLVAALVLAVESLQIGGKYRRYQLVTASNSYHGKWENRLDMAVSDDTDESNVNNSGENDVQNEVDSPGAVIYSLIYLLTYLLTYLSLIYYLRSI